MANNSVNYGDKLIEKRNLVKYRISDFLNAKNIDTKKICTDAANAEDYGGYLISPNATTLRGYHSTAKGKVPIEYLITLHDLYEAPYDYLFGVQDNLYDEKDIKSKLNLGAYNTIAELSKDSFDTQLLNYILENYITDFIGKLRTALIMKAISDGLNEDESDADFDLYDNSLEEDLHFFVVQMYKSILKDKTITIDHKMMKDKYNAVLKGLKNRADCFQLAYEQLNDAFINDKTYLDVIKKMEKDKRTNPKAIALKEILLNE